ncbi:MarR family transcriptional regulator [Tessaracoccus sp. MC1865]|uniref:MarR family winged helix-turn-helix transcriptional regulator n=1 Tax=unclassified Tessaracoccus TaxID=2635419 RepID=UPI0015FFC64C|nr:MULTISPECIES: MarR family transcriptional regulator [unclassified Tessaracoccus]MBB1484386.1 MarR family transcriptional regulator [Tessaracoccus sp. MC1865]MBB1509253.1 MarR family transcriptional regulator [Tessaracoccus sp. MC1756]QTO38506.1 MarR family transcriptional regulator [Tessaracoccus sp. MC1865]
MAQAYHPDAYAMQAIIALSNGLERELARLLGLNATDYRALSTLQQLPRDKAVTLGDLGGALGTSAATTSALVDRLERAGYVVRRRGEVDRRQVTLETTPLGWTRIMALMRPLMDATDDHLKALNADEVRAVSAFLRFMNTCLAERLESLATLESAQ